MKLFTRTTSSSIHSQLLLLYSLSILILSSGARSGNINVSESPARLSSGFNPRRRTPTNPHIYYNRPHYRSVDPFTRYRRRPPVNRRSSSSDSDDSNGAVPSPSAASRSSSSNTNLLKSRFRWKEYSPNLLRKRYDMRGFRKHRTNITGTLLAMNVGVFFAQLLFPSVTKWGANLPGDIFQEPRRLITPIFLHGGFSHLLVNSFSLNNIGPALEGHLGPRRFLMTYLMSGVAGNALSATYNNVPSVGASGAIFGLMGAYATFVKVNEQFYGRSGRGALENIVRVGGMNLLLGFMNPRVDNWGHVGGAIGGAFMGYCFGPRLYMMQTPIGQMIVDDPIVDVSGNSVFEAIEKIPKRIKSGLQKRKRDLHFDKYLNGLPDGNNLKRRIMKRR